MAKAAISLQPSEGIVARMAATIYAAYVTAGRVAEGQEKVWIQRSVQEASLMARITDELILSDSELA
jgi:hypothetical protein